MDDETKTQLNRFLGNMNSAIEAGTDLAVEQFPLVVQDIITWGRLYHTGCLAFVLAAVIGLCWYWKTRGIAIAKKAIAEEEECVIPGFQVMIALAFATIIVFTVGGCVVETHLSLCLKAWFVPRLYVIEYISNLIS